jgi:hypothetical protein
MRTSFVKSRLGAMMFLQYVIWGSWYVTLNTYLTSTLGFSGTQAGAVFGTTAVASLVSPFFVGLVADRFFATERVLAVLYALGAVFVLLVTQVSSFSAVYGLLLAFCLCYFPTIALTNSITMQQVRDPGRDFPPIRTMGIPQRSGGRERRGQDDARAVLRSRDDAADARGIPNPECEIHPARRPVRVGASVRHAGLR